jgi:hypothetical protein
LKEQTSRWQEDGSFVNTVSGGFEVMTVITKLFIQKRKMKVYHQKEEAQTNPRTIGAD